MAYDEDEYRRHLQQMRKWTLEDWAKYALAGLVRNVITGTIIATLTVVILIVGLPYVVPLLHYTIRAVLEILEGFEGRSDVNLCPIGCILSFMLAYSIFG